ncbi:uncharacterized protein LOC131162652 [Malania oleifera]|uniref:uncharacterized protein LOC131162652 n=1 Tax=Malania oleifera TaxID=397392 RepID=UPI0025AE8107|nr:uncharacterized protein LOC131162652 [Malania oleifera]
MKRIYQFLFLKKPKNGQHTELPHYQSRQIVIEGEVRKKPLPRINPLYIYCQFEGVFDFNDRFQTKPIETLPLTKFKGGSESSVNGNSDDVMKTLDQLAFKCRKFPAVNVLCAADCCTCNSTRSRKILTSTSVVIHNESCFCYNSTWHDVYHLKLGS